MVVLKTVVSENSWQQNFSIEYLQSAEVREVSENSAQREKGSIYCNFMRVKFIYLIYMLAIAI